MAIFAWGDIDEIVCQSPTLGSKRFFPKSAEDYTIDFGGIRTADDANSITANAQDIKIMNRVRWRLEGPVAVDTESSELIYINSLHELAESPTWTITFLNGAIYKGVGGPVGDVQLSSNAGTMSLILAGGGKLEKI